MNMRDLTVFNNFMDDFYGLGKKAVGAKQLNVDWDSNDDGYIIRLELPGVDEKNINIDVENNILTVKAEYDEKDGNSLRSGKYKWSAEIMDVDIENITANLDKGILVVNVPKSEKSKPKRIEIGVK